MANFTAADVKALREQTGAGMMDVKKALTEADGDAEKALEIIRLKGLKSLSKREGRQASAGLLAAQTDGTVGVLVEVNSETDFVAKNQKFIDFSNEVLAAALQAGMLLVICVMVAWEGAWRLASPPKVEAGPMLLVGIIGLVANVVSLVILAGGREANLNMKAAFLEVANDALGSLAVIVAAGAEWAFGWTRADAIASLLIALLMAPRALTLLRRSVAILMEEAPASVDMTELRAHMMGVDGVLDVHDLHVAAVSSHLVTVTAHVTVTHEADGPSRDRIVHELGECACHHFPIAHSTFQLECPQHREHEHLGH